MINRHALLAEIDSTMQFFATSTKVFEEGDSGYRPLPELYSVAGQVEHVALTIDWFHDAVFGEGWDMDFAGHVETARACTSLVAAREHLRRSAERLKAAIAGADEAVLAGSFPAADPILPGLPHMAIISGLVDHTAHHRGALTVYARLLGREPLMPYLPQ